MAFLVGGANSASGAYEISNSCRFNRGDSPALSYSFSSTDSSWTVSCWIKRAELSTNTMYPFGFGTAGTDATGVSFSGSDSMAYYDEDGSTLVRDTTILFRDPSAWYHVVCKNDGGTITTYMNGVQQATGSGGEALDGSTFYVGRFAGSTAYHWDGYISEFYFIDGTAYSPSTFAETNDNGVWVPIEASPTFGSDGFFCEFKETGTSANSSGIGADTSGNDNHLTVSNLAATDITTDTPTNNFCTLNPLAAVNGGAPGTLPTFSEGNTQITVGDGTARFAVGTFATSMPYYFEVKVSAISASDSAQRIGIVDEDAMGAATTYYAQYQGDGEIIASGETTVTGEDTITANDIIGVAVDLATNNNVKFYENGDLQTTMSVGASYQGLSTTPFSRLVNATTTFQFNFGNPPYSNSSSAADANGYGDFEYAPPSGYYALCTKNLAEYG